MKFTRIFALAAGLSLAATFAAPVNASTASIIELDDGVNPTVSVTDGLAGDLCAVGGCVTYSGTIGVWLINVSTGVGPPVLGTLAKPHLDLNSVNTSTGAGTMKIAFTAFDFTSGDLSMFSEVGGTAGGTVQFQTWFDPTNSGKYSVADGAILVEDLGPTSTSPFSLKGLSGLSALSPYSLTLLAILTHGSGVHATSFDFSSHTVPEPMSLSLLGLGLLSLGLARKRRAA